jgi:hypothetical protein
MSQRFVRALPWVAAIGFVVAIASLGVGTFERERALAEGDRTRPFVAGSVERVLQRRPSSVNEAAFQQAVEALRRTPHVATVWLFAPDGRLVMASGSTAASTPVGMTADELATDETRRVVQAIQATLAPEQRTMMLVAAAIMREGEHNDIYRHTVRPVIGQDGSTVGYLGVGYAASPALAASPLMKIVFLIFLAGLATYWLSLPAWVLFDARARGMRAWAWAGFVLVANLVALVVYLFARVPGPVGATA